MAEKLSGLPIAFLVANEGIEQVELTEPWEAVRSEGGMPVLVAPHAGEVAMFRHLDRGDTWPVDTTVDQARPGEYAALVLPGGVANADLLRMDARAVGFTRGFVESGKPIAVICHGPWTLVEADAVRGRRITSYRSLRTDIRNAGGEWVDQEVVVCDREPSVFVSSRGPDDLPAFCRTLVERFSQQAVATR